MAQLDKNTGWTKIERYIDWGRSEKREGLIQLRMDP